MSVIFADTTCDLEKSQVKKLNINLVNLELKDKVSAFKKAFQPYLDENEDILYLSTNYSIIKNDFEESVKYFGNLYDKRVIKHIDLDTCSVTAGLIVYEAGLMYKRGCTDLEIIDFVNNFKNETFGFVITQNKEFLTKKCVTSDKININSSSNLINPIILVNKNKFEVVDKAPGKKKAIGNLVNLINDYSINVADYPLIVAHGDDVANAEYLKNTIINKFGEDTVVLLQKFSPENEKLFDKNTLYVGFYSKKLRN